MVLISGSVIEGDSKVGNISDGIIVDIYVRRSKYVEVWHRVSDQARSQF